MTALKQNSKEIVNKLVIAYSCIIINIFDILYMLKPIKGKLMKRVITLILFTTFALIANDCDYALRMGSLQENAAAKAYTAGNLVKTQEHLRVALHNYMKGFKPCLNTPKEDELINSTARVNGILTDKNFGDAAALQKFFKSK